MELYTDKDGVLVSLAQYMTTTAQKKKRIAEELQELKTRLRALREKVDMFHALEVARKGRLSYKERETYLQIKEEHGRHYKNVEALKVLMSKWMYV